MLVARQLESGALARPVSYELVWSVSNMLAIWKPIPPQGYVCLGMIAQFGNDPPSLDEVMCVDQALAAPGKLGKEIWPSSGSSYLVPADEKGILIGGFTDVSHLNDLYVLDARAVQGADVRFGREDIEGLIEDFGPFLWFHADEQYDLDNLEWVLNNGVTLSWALVENEMDYGTHQENHGDGMATSSATLMDDVEYVLNNVKPNPPYNNSPSFKYWLNIPNQLKPGNLSRAKAIVRVVPWNTIFTEIQFWFFYPFNGPGRVRICSVSWACKWIQMAEPGRHFGDWESVTLLFLNTSKDLVSVNMSAHGQIKWFGSDDLGSALQFDGAHPVVYAGKYSHAHYETATRTSTIICEYGSWIMGLVRRP